VTTLAGARLVLPDRVVHPAWLSYTGSRIEALGDDRPPPGTLDVVDVQGAYVTPGYVDLHMHGGGGHSITASRADMLAAAAFHLAHGTTTTLVSAVTDPVDRMVDVIAWAAELTTPPPPAADPAAAPRPAPDLDQRRLSAGFRRFPGVDHGSGASTIVGSHLEGPFLADAHRGAHDPALLRRPDPAVLDRLLAPGGVRMVTFAPELPGAGALLARLVAAGVIAAVGHTAATYEQATAAFDGGARVLTHAYNGMSGIHHRAPGPVTAAIDHPRATAELILDGEHVHVPAARLLFRAMPGRVALVTDAMAAAGAADGAYDLGNLRVQVAGGVARLVPDVGKPAGSLAGSTLTMDAAVRRAVQQLGLGVEEAVAAASLVPARVLGINAGRLRPGYRADILVLDHDLRVLEVRSAGVRTA
jgi:N-acetylglucosamine-6-phosphate deacetylase